MKKRNHSFQILIWVLIVMIICILLFFGIISGYSSYIFGFRGYSIPKSDTEEWIPPKLVWDWLNLLVIPAFLLIGGFLLNFFENRRKLRITTQQHKIELDIANNNNQLDRFLDDRKQQEDNLHRYYDSVSQYLLEKPIEIRKKIIQAKTFSTIRVLDSYRKGLLLKFLYDMDLILGETPILELKYADFSETEWLGNIYENINISFIDFRFSDFKKILIKKGIFQEVIFSGADLSNCIFDNCKFDNCKFELKTKLSGITINHSELSSLKFSNRLSKHQYANWKISGTKFINVEFNNNDFFTAIFKDVYLFKSKLIGVSFIKSDISRTSLIDCFLDNLIYTPINNSEYLKLNDSTIYLSSFMKLLVDDMDCTSTKIVKSNMTEMIVTRPIFKFANIVDSFFSDSILKNSNFYKVHLQNVDFTGADLRGSNFKGAIMEDVVFEKTKLQSADFSNTYLKNVRFCDTNLDTTKFNHVTTDNVIFE